MSDEQDWQDFYDEMVELKKDNDRLTAEVERLEGALTELRDEIIPDWSKREAITFIDETIGSD